MKRRVFVLENGVWKEVDMINIKKGNIFRIIEAGQTDYLKVGNETDFTAFSDAYYNEDNIVTVQIDMNTINKQQYGMGFKD
jgi:hypothetical protein